MSTNLGNDNDDDPRFLLPQGVGDTEDIERYKAGGFHPVHLGDCFDGDRYKVVHKFGAGGFSTVWLARDKRMDVWVALKVVDAEHSASTEEKITLIRSTLQRGGLLMPNEDHRQFTITGPNGRHLCLVLPVLGPAMSDLSYHFNCRLTPSFARRVALQATRAVVNIHAQGLCHGDVTTGNLLLSLEDINSYHEEDILHLIGRPFTAPLETESGESSFPEAPRYIVKNIDFLTTTRNIIRPEINLIDFDQCFPSSSPPQKMLGTPLEFLAPEVATGRPASPASDVWALGCCIFRLRAGEGPFSSPFDVTCPEDLVSYIIHTLDGEMPEEWQENTLWDQHGWPTKDANEGKPHEQYWEGDERSLKDLVYGVWDEPKGRAVETGATSAERRMFLKHEHEPFPPQFSSMVWNPKAIKVDGAYLVGYDDEWPIKFAALPKIPDSEAALLYDLLSQIFVYDLAMRPTAEEILKHPWFHIDEPHGSLKKRLGALSLAVCTLSQEPEISRSISYFQQKGC